MLFPILNIAVGSRLVLEEVQFENEYARKNGNNNFFIMDGVKFQANKKFYISTDGQSSSLQIQVDVPKNYSGPPIIVSLLSTGYIISPPEITITFPTNLKKNFI